MKAAQTNLAGSATDCYPFVQSIERLIESLPNLLLRYARQSELTHTTLSDYLRKQLARPGSEVAREHQNLLDHLTFHQPCRVVLYNKIAEKLKSVGCPRIQDLIACAFGSDHPSLRSSYAHIESCLECKEEVDKIQKLFP